MYEERLMNRRTILVVSGFAILITLACNATFSVGYPTPMNEAPTAIPTNTSIPLSAQVTLVSQPYIETNQDPAYTITAQIPQLSGSDDPRVLAFNQLMDQTVQKEIAILREEFNRGPIVEATTNSNLGVTYTIISQYDDIWSLKFQYVFYVNGAAHPSDFSHTVNYNLATGRYVVLTDIFLPDSNYLEVISNYCANKLRKQPYSDSFSLDGASPTLENYRNWNISRDGFMVTFDTYQVAPGAAGPQVIVIPYDQLRAIIKPDGPLQGFVK
jgi:hypothetical protein